MPQVKPTWTKIDEFDKMAKQIVAKYPDFFSGLNPEWIVAYGSSKDRPEGKAKPYDMTGEGEPESFTNAKKYFVKFFMSDWEAKNETQKLALVFSALLRIDRENPESGKVGPLDYRDQNMMVRTFGADWQLHANLPNILKDDVNFVEEPQVR